MASQFPNVKACVIGDHWANGGAGCEDLAKAVRDVVDNQGGNNGQFRHIYSDDAPLKDKIGAVAKEIYRADGVEYSSEATAALKQFQQGKN